MAAGTLPPDSSWLYADCDLIPGLVRLGWRRLTAARPLANHRHEGVHEFVYMESGSITWELSGESHPTNAEQWFYAPPGEWHKPRFNNLEPSVFWWFHVRDLAQESDWFNLNKDERHHVGQVFANLPQVFPADIRVRNQFAHMKKIIDENAPFAYMYVRTILLDIILHLFRSAPVRDVSPELKDAMQRITALLDRTPEQRRSVRELAAELNVSESNFYRLFHDLYGQSPASYMERVRIRRACEMLSLTSETITHIAMELGYKTSQHFSTTFKKYVGVTPRQFRREK